MADVQAVLVQLKRDGRTIAHCAQPDVTAHDVQYLAWRVAEYMQPSRSAARRQQRQMQQQQQQQRRRRRVEQGTGGGTAAGTPDGSTAFRSGRSALGAGGGPVGASARDTVPGGRDEFDLLDFTDEERRAQRKRQLAAGNHAGGSGGGGADGGGAAAVTDDDDDDHSVYRFRLAGVRPLRWQTPPEMLVSNNIGQLHSHEGGGARATASRLRVCVAWHRHDVHSASEAERVLARAEMLVRRFDATEFEGNARLLCRLNAALLYLVCGYDAAELEASWRESPTTRVYDSKEMAAWREKRRAELDERRRHQQQQQQQRRRLEGEVRSDGADAAVAGTNTAVATPAATTETAWKTSPDEPTGASRTPSVWGNGRGTGHGAADTTGSRDAIDITDEPASLTVTTATAAVAVPALPPAVPVPVSTPSFIHASRRALQATLFGSDASARVGDAWFDDFLLSDDLATEGLYDTAADDDDSEHRETGDQGADASDGASDTASSVSTISAMDLWVLDNSALSVPGLAAELLDRAEFDEARMLARAYSDTFCKRIGAYLRPALYLFERGSFQHALSVLRSNIVPGLLQERQRSERGERGGVASGGGGVRDGADDPSSARLGARRDLAMTSEDAKTRDGDVEKGEAGAGGDDDDAGAHTRNASATANSAKGGENDGSERDVHVDKNEAAVRAAPPGDCRGDAGDAVVSDEWRAGATDSSTSAQSSVPAPSRVTDAQPDRGRGDARDDLASADDDAGTERDAHKHDATDEMRGGREREYGDSGDERSARPERDTRESGNDNDGDEDGSNDKTRRGRRPRAADTVRSAERDAPQRAVSVSPNLGRTVRHVETGLDARAARETCTIDTPSPRSDANHEQEVSPASVAAAAPVARNRRAQSEPPSLAATNAPATPSVAASDDLSRRTEAELDTALDVDLEPTIEPPSDDTKRLFLMTCWYKLALRILQHISDVERAIKLAAFSQAARTANSGGDNHAAATDDIDTGGHDSDGTRRARTLAHLATLLAFVPLLPQHRAACVRVCVDKCMRIGNYGDAVAWIDAVYDASSPEAQRQFDAMLDECQDALGGGDDGRELAARDSEYRGDDGGNERDKRNAYPTPSVDNLMEYYGRGALTLKEYLLLAREEGERGSLWRAVAPNEPASDADGGPGDAEARGSA